MTGLIVLVIVVFLAVACLRSWDNLIGLGSKKKSETNLQRYTQSEKPCPPCAETMPGGSSQESMNLFEKVLSWAVLIFFYVIWSTLGLLAWVALLLRSMLLWSVAMWQDMFDTGAADRASQARATLAHVILLWIAGFRLAWEVMFKNKQTEAKRDTRNWDVWAWDSAYALAFWLLVFFMHPIWRHIWGK